MANGHPQSDRDFLIEISTDVKHIKKSQDVLFKKQASLEKDVSGLKVEQASTKGRCNVENNRMESLEKDIKAKPSTAKIVLLISLVVGIITSLGVYANSFN